jgi:hypothetical protein
MCWTTRCRIFTQWVSVWYITLHNFRVAAVCSYLVLALIKSEHDLVQTHLQSLRLRPDVSLSYLSCRFTNDKQEPAGPRKWHSEELRILLSLLDTPALQTVSSYYFPQWSCLPCTCIRWSVIELCVLFKVICRMYLRGIVIIELTLLVNFKILRFMSLQPKNLSDYLTIIPLSYIW